MATCRFLIRVHPRFIRGSFLFDLPLLRPSHEYHHNPRPDVDQGVGSAEWRAGRRSDNPRFSRRGRERTHRPRRADVELSGAAAFGREDDVS